MPKLMRSFSLRSVRFTTVAMLTFVGVYLTPGAAQQAARVSPDVYSQLRWRFIGPEGNRISAVVGVPGNPLVYYAGSASGGIAKTVDGGVHWQQVFDDHPVQSISALTVAPSDSNVVWAGTGEGARRGPVVVVPRLRHYL